MQSGNCKAVESLPSSRCYDATGRDGVLFWIRRFRGDDKGRYFFPQQGLIIPLLVSPLVNSCILFAWRQYDCSGCGSVRCDPANDIGVAASEYRIALSESLQLA